MKKYTMFLDQKNQYSDNKYTTQGDLLVHSFTTDTLRFNCGIPIQPFNSVSHWTRTYNFTICVETQKTSNEQNNLEKERKWRNQPSWLQIVLQSYSHQDSKVLAQRQKFRSMGKNRKSRDKATHTWTLYLWRGGKNIQHRKDSLLDKQCWENGSTTLKEWNIYSFLTPQRK